MKIDFWCTGNVPFNPDILWGKGLGGAENAVVFLAEELGQQGHEMTVWNETPASTQYGPVWYRPLHEGSLDIKTDLFVIFRVSIPTRPPNAKHVVFFSCDQATDIGWSRMFPWLERFICISRYHANYILAHYPVAMATLRVCELGVNIADYSEPVKKVSGRMIFCSVPYRGLHILLKLWPQIRERVPNASLAITCDYTLWGRSNDPANQPFRAMAAQLSNIEFYGAVPRAELVRLQREAEIMPFPCVYEENFCISAMECIAAGAVPVTTAIGALPTTVAESGMIINNSPETPAGEEDFVQAVVALSVDESSWEQIALEGRERARQDYSYTAVAKRFLKAALE